MPRKGGRLVSSVYLSFGQMWRSFGEIVSIGLFFYPKWQVFFKKCVFKKLAFQHRESGVNLKKEERSVGDLHEHRTLKVNGSFDAA
ncbi:hypothetical protein ABD77_03750 [Brevibacillus formosus]|nr:hypothetical protein [Brevibacillus formosus]